jgi:hypothetical protein
MGGRATVVMANGAAASVVGRAPAQRLAEVLANHDLDVQGGFNLLRIAADEIPITSLTGRPRA